MSPSIARIECSPKQTPLHSPFTTSQGTAVAALALGVTMTLDDGRVSLGETVPVTYVTGETMEMAREGIERAAHSLIGLDIARFRTAFDLIRAAAPEAPAARCGLEQALLAAWSQTVGISLAQLWGGALPSVETDLTIPISPNATELTELAWALGMRIFKIKVGEADVEADHARVLEVRAAAPDAHLRIDANQAFTREGALCFIERLLKEGAHVEMLEQPVRRDDFEGMAWVAERSPVPVFADESCRSTRDALRLADTAVQGYNCKIQKSGISTVLDIVAIARAAGKRLMLGCMLETRQSIAFSLALACGTGAFDFIDLDSHLLLNEAGDNPSFSQEGARLICH